MEYKGIDNKEAYNKGLNDAWELARKIVLPESEGGMKIDELKNIFKNHRYFDINDILKRYTPQEALAKLEAYEKEQNEVKIGDIIAIDDDRVVVTKVNKCESCTTIYGFKENGCCIFYSDKQFKKTGTHIDIQKILNKLKEGV